MSKHQQTHTTLSKGDICEMAWELNGPLHNLDASWTMSLLCEEAEGAVLDVVDEYCYDHPGEIVGRKLVEDALVLMIHQVEQKAMNMVADAEEERLSDIRDGLIDENGDAIGDRRSYSR